MQRSIYLITQLNILIENVKMFNAKHLVGITPSIKMKSSFSSLTDQNAIQKSYKDAIRMLNSLQPNAVTVKKSINNPYQNNLEITAKYLKRSGLSMDKLDELSVIHVSGTKGKGSTCALTESILRSFGMKTGFFSSPHLISVTERIQLNGKPISEDKFTEYFFDIFESLDKQKRIDHDMPAYFTFLTILCFHIFIRENVDVVILEVGIGGEFDCTNIVRNVKTVGITSLGLEHTKLLGDTLDKIAWQKAGIIKENSNVFTLQQSDECLNVIQKRANEKRANLFIVPELSMYKWKEQPKLQIQNKAQNSNASLAIQLAYDWLRKNRLKDLNGFSRNIAESQVCLEISENTKEALESCFWPGRCQLVECGRFRIYLDGAHTVESINICIDWFKNSTKESENPKVLIFNSTGDRDSQKLLKMLSEENFNKAYFVPNIAYNFDGNDLDTINMKVYPEQIHRAKRHSIYWNSIKSSNSQNYSSILNAFNAISEEFDDKKTVEILVTGSLHLIGATILALEEFNKFEINKLK